MSDGLTPALNDEGPRRIEAGRVSLFLDLDGTLAPFAGTPEGVGPDAARNARLRRVVEMLDGRMAIVSGRSIDDLDRILEGAVAALAGSHGLQRRTSGRDVFGTPPHPRLIEAVEEVRAFAGGFPGVRVETKPLSVAFHYRGNPDVEPVARVFADDLARRTGLKLQTGAKVVEFLTPGADKGEAITAFMAEAPFAGTVPLFVGDDQTDEDGFSAVIPYGGMGILVGRERATHACFRLEDEVRVHAWLEQAIEQKVFSLEFPIGPSYRRI